MKKLCTFLLVFCFILALTPTVAASDTTRHGYSLLENDLQRRAYQKIADGVAALQTPIQFSVAGLTGSLTNTQVCNEINKAVMMVFHDFPEYFWFSGGGTASCDSAGNATFTPKTYTAGGKTMTAGGQDYQNAQSAINAAVSAALAKIPGGASDYDKALILHDHLAEIVNYVSQDDDQTVYGALGEGEAVCAGYAKAYQLLMNKAGIKCWYVTGESYNPSGVKEGHAWNLVWLDGKCFYTDVTWDDQKGEIFHEYFNISYAEASRTHFEDVPLPSCGHSGYSYYEKNHGNGVCLMSASTTAEEFANCFVHTAVDGDKHTYTCVVHAYDDNFATWLQQNLQTIVLKIGLNGCSAAINYTGRGYKVSLTGPLMDQNQPPQNTEPGNQNTQPSTQTTVPAETTPSQPAQPGPTQTTEPSSQQTTPSTEAASPSESTPAVPPTDSTTQSQPEGSSEPSQSTVASDDGQASEPSGTSLPATQAGTSSGAIPESAPPAEEKGNGPNTTAIIIVAAAAVLIIGGSAAVIVVLKKRRS